MSICLKPKELSADEKRLTVEIFCLPEGKYVRRQLRHPPASPTNTSTSARGTWLDDIQTGQRIQSGDVVVFTTSNPKDLPLPSIDLLQMQWTLHRLTALSGAADASDDELDLDNALGLAPPISVEEEIDIGLSGEEAEEEGEEAQEED
ncbi:hypothetical protein BDW62DRAFT_154146 [Aspergillus aurantiobrunneus]